MTMEMSPKKQNMLRGFHRLPFSKFIVCTFCASSLYTVCCLGSACIHSSKRCYGSKDVVGMCSGTYSVPSGICSLGSLPCPTLNENTLPKMWN